MKKTRSERKSEMPTIQWLKYSRFNQKLKKKFERILQENPLCSVVDLEEEQVQVNRFAFAYSPPRSDYQQFFYLEYDKRIKLSMDKVETILHKNDDPCVKVFKKVKHFARKIRVSSDGDSCIEVTQGRKDF